MNQKDTGAAFVPNEMTIRFRATDGTVFMITGRGSIDYVLNPIFLKFVFICCAFYGLLDKNGDLPGLFGWQFFAAWVLVILVILVWLSASGAVLRMLFQHRLIREVWTPVILLPMLMVIEVAMQAIPYFFAGTPLKTWGTTISDLTRDFVIVSLMDILHGQYVVARHPQARFDGKGPIETATKGSVTEVSSPSRLSIVDLQPVAEMADQYKPIADQRVGKDLPMSILIGAENFAVTDILVIRIEDHYLNITTRSRRSLQRAKLSGISTLHEGGFGIQINRSVWVSFAAITKAEPMKNGQILLVLSNGDEELVAKTRVHAFRQAFRMTPNTHQDAPA